MSSEPDDDQASLGGEARLVIMKGKAIMCGLYNAAAEL